MFRSRSWRRLALASTLGAVVAATGCDSSPTAPSPGGIATIRVVDETFRIRLVDAAQVIAAERARNGTGPRIPVGRIVAGTQVNAGYSWHLEDVTFADATIELCDGLPSMVERQGPAFANGQYCPWGAVVTRIDRD